MFDLKKVKLPKKQHIDEVMRLVKITDVSNRIIKNLSKGYRQRVGFAQALLGNPPVLILDEPTVGLDPQQIIEMRKLIKSLGKKHTVILSSHVLSEISATCDRIVVISNGKLVADARTDELSSSISGAQKLQLDLDGTEGSAASALKGISVIDGVTKIKKQGSVGNNITRYVIDYQTGVDIRKSVFRAVASTDCAIVGMESGNATLEDSFLQLTSQDQRQKEVK